MVDFTSSYVCWPGGEGIQKFSGKDVQDYMEFQSDTESQSRSSGKSGTRSEKPIGGFCWLDSVFVEGSLFSCFGGEKIDPLVWEFYWNILYSMQHTYIYI